MGRAQWGCTISKTTKPKYNGILAEKFPAPKPGEELLTEAFRAEWHDRLMLLFDLYGVSRPSVFSDENEARWRQIALSLAFHHVPGLQIANPGGAPKRWQLRQCTKLYVDVMLYCHRHSRKSESEACHNLVKNEPWCSFIDSDRAAQTLYRKLKEIERQQPSLVALVEKIKRQWPDDIENNLQIVSERFNF